MNDRLTPPAALFSGPCGRQAARTDLCLVIGTSAVVYPAAGIVLPKLLEP